LVDSYLYRPGVPSSTSQGDAGGGVGHVVFVGKGGERGRRRRERERERREEREGRGIGRSSPENESKCKNRKENARYLRDAYNRRKKGDLKCGKRTDSRKIKEEKG
jgi:hypothetical protein